MSETRIKLMCDVSLEATEKFGGTVSDKELSIFFGQALEVFGLDFEQAAIVLSLTLSDYAQFLSDAEGRDGAEEPVVQ